MRELELLMVDRPDDPKVEGMDMTSGVGLDIQERAAEGPDLHGPLPEKLLEELCDDLGDDALLSEDGDPIPGLVTRLLPSKQPSKTPRVSCAKGSSKTQVRPPISAHRLQDLHLVDQDASRHDLRASVLDHQST